MDFFFTLCLDKWKKELSLYRIKNVIIMSDKKTMNEELVMEYSPILGVSYGLVNVNPENEDTEEEKKD